MDHMTSVSMDKDRSHVTERILELTLEIVYLLTKERFPRLMSGDNTTITVPPCDSLKPERPNMEKILEVTQKMIDLLRGEVPIRCQDVTVYFSMEEWEYLEGHKDLYKDVMMEDEPDGSRKRNPPQKCPRPLEDLPIPHQEQVGEAEGHKDLYKDIMMKPPNDRNPPQRCPSPRDSTQEDLPFPQYDQCEDLKDIKVEVVEEEEEESLMSGAQESMEEEEIMMRSIKEESSPHWDAYGRFVGDMNTSEGHFIFPPDYNDIAQHSPAVNPFTYNIHHRPFHPQISVDPFNPQGSSYQAYSFTAESHRRYPSTQRATNPTQAKGTSTKQRKDKPGECSLPHSQPREFYTPKVNLNNHASERPFSCSICSKSFILKSALARHQKIHTGERPHLCSVCGKSFLQKAELIIHLRRHTGERPYSCSVCGKSFVHKADLVKHQKIHTGERPFSCSVCGKCFIEKSKLLIHQRIHTGERPYSCSVCGKRFNENGDLLKHQNVHSKEKGFSCSECGHSFKHKRSLIRHRSAHNC